MKQNKMYLQKIMKRLVSAALAVCVLGTTISIPVQAANPTNSWRKTSPGVWSYYDANGNVTASDSTSIKGIDVSKYQGNIDWNQVRGDGIEFAFIRAGHGDHTLDPKFVQNMKGANEAGVKAGVYFYSTAQNPAQSASDAQFVINNLNGLTVSYPIAIDVEDKSMAGLGKSAVADIIIAFCNEISAAGYYPMVYCNENWYRNYIDTAKIAGISKWIAAYRSAPSADIPRDIWQCTSNSAVAGINARVDGDFGYTNFANIITPRSQPDANYTAVNGAWVKDSKGWWFQRSDGSYPRNGWEKIRGFWYHFNAKGYMETGWKAVDGIWYFLNNDGMMVTGWAKLGSKWYYFYGNGAMAAGWVNIGSEWYYLDKNGVMCTGWKAVDGIWYYLNESGAMLTGWIKLGNTWYYLYDNGAMASGWVNINDSWFYLDSSGAMAIGWKDVKGTWYYLNHNGVMLTGWLNLGGTWYYLLPNGAMATGWVQLGDTWYYMETSGAMLASTQKTINGKAYTFSADGSCVNP